MARYKVDMLRWGFHQARYYDIYTVARDVFDALVKSARWTHDAPVIIKLIRVDPITREPKALLGVYKEDGGMYE